jgi:hypothetical protein
LRRMLDPALGEIVGAKEPFDLSLLDDAVVVEGRSAESVGAIGVEDGGAAAAGIGGGDRASSGRGRRSWSGGGLGATPP